MITSLQLSGSLAPQARAEASRFSARRVLDRIVASLLAAMTDAILRSRRGIFPGVRYPLFELRRQAPRHGHSGLVLPPSLLEFRRDQPPAPE